jgi:hypothetical protein
MIECESWVWCMVRAAIIETMFLRTNLASMLSSDTGFDRRQS